MSTQPKSPHLEAALLAAHRAMRRPQLADDRRPWIWPLPELNGCAPIVFDPILAQLFGEPDAPEQPRILMAYPRYMYSDGAAAFLNGTRSASTLFFLPSYTPVFAAQDGAITEAERTADGYKVLVEHAGGWTTRYDNLERIFCRPRWFGSRGRTEKVRAGDVIGYAGGSSLDAGAMRTFRFELWREFRSVDPRPRMETWLFLPHTDGRLDDPCVDLASNIQQAA